MMIITMMMMMMMMMRINCGGIPKMHGPRKEANKQNKSGVGKNQLKTKSTGNKRNKNVSPCPRLSTARGPCLYNIS